MHQNDLKQRISKWINVEQNLLNEISIEDVKLNPAAQTSVSRIVDELLRSGNPVLSFQDSQSLLADGIPCRGYWVENTEDLVIYLRIHKLSRTIVVPRSCWIVRDDISIN
jgi:hypothetical protein